MMPELANTLDTIRTSLNGTTDRRDRSKIGQFFTPAKIARFMASLFNKGEGDVRILDPGAGTGVLFAACVEALVSRELRLHSLQVIAYENDERLLPYLKETMGRVEAICKAAGIPFQGKIRAEDFVSGAIAHTEKNLVTSAGKPFTHAILNPPYKKINSLTASRRLLDAEGIGVSNLYAAFVWLTVRMLKPGGELVAITPRSFCNGPYFRKFRMSFLDMMSLRRVHVFELRNKAFGDDNVLQENVIYHAVKGKRKPENIIVSSSEGADFHNVKSRSVPYKHVILPADRDAFIHLVLSKTDDDLINRKRSFKTSLTKLRVDISTGRVVNFRARDCLRSRPENGTAPLIHPCHFENGFIKWPMEPAKKPNAIIFSEETCGLLVAAGYYVLTKRFSSKEEPRRVMAAVYDPNRIEAPLVGFENHLNYFHVQGEGMGENLAKGLALYLNSSFFDKYFRLFSGHTQVNATDLRKMHYPSREQLVRLGKHVNDQMPDQGTVDDILRRECICDG